MCKTRYHIYVLLGIISLLSLTSCTKAEGHDDPEYPEAKSIVLSQTTVKLSLGSKATTLKVTTDPAEVADLVTWESSEPETVRVDSNGRLTALSCGTATITASYGDTSAQCMVYVYHLSVDCTERFTYIGRTLHISASTGVVIPGASVTWTSSNKEVATVSNGVIEAQGEGEATIVVTYLSEFKQIKIKVGDMVAEFLPQALKSENLSAHIYSKNVALTSKKRITQSFEICDSGEIYYTQLGGGAYHNYICHTTGPNTNVVAGDRMDVVHFGHGTQLIVENEDSDAYIWFNTNGTLAEEPTEAGTQYEDNRTFSRFRFQKGRQYDATTGYYDGYPNDGEHFTIGVDKVEQQMSIDFRSRKILVSCESSGISGRDFYVYRLDDVLALPLTTVSFQVEIGNGYADDCAYQKVTRTLQVHDMSTLRPLHYFQIKRDKTGDPAKKVFYYGFQGHQIRGNYIYFYEGWYKSGTKYTNEPDAYVTILTLDGDVKARCGVMAVNNHADLLEQCGISTTGYAEGEGLQVRDSIVYLGFGCHSNGSEDRRVLILKYDMSNPNI